MSTFRDELERRRIARLLNPYAPIRWEIPPSPNSRRAGLQWLREGMKDPRPDPRTHPEYWTE